MPGWPRARRRPTATKPAWPQLRLPAQRRQLALLKLPAPAWANTDAFEARQAPDFDYYLVRSGTGDQMDREPSLKVLERQGAWTLYQRIHNRTDAMLQAGWLEEVSLLDSGGLPENAKPFNFIGYRELRSHLRGEITLDAARSAIQQGTRQYAKRQLTWFRREKDVNWLAGFGDNQDVQSAARDWLTAQLDSADS